MNTVESSIDLRAVLTRTRVRLNQDPDNPHLLSEAAETALHLGEFDAGKTYARHALEVNPNAPGLLHTLGLLELASGNAQEARSAFERLVEQGITAPAVRYNLAYTLMLNNEFSRVCELLADAEEVAAVVPAAPALFVRALHCLGEVDQAIAFAEKHLEHHPDDGVVCGLLSTLYIDAENFDGAALQAERAKALGQGTAEAWITSGTLELAEQRDAAAIEHFDRAIKEAPTSGRAWVGSGLAHLLADDRTQAIAALREATRRMPEHIGTWHALGWAQIINDEIAEARRTFEHSLSLDRNFSESHGALAVIAFIEGNHQEANIATQRALGLDKACFSGMFARSLLLNAKGHPEAGRKIIEGIMNSSVLPNGRTLRQALIAHIGQRNPRR